MTLDTLVPAHVLGIWAAGLAVAAAVVTGWRIVGRGYTWLAAGTTLLFAVPAALIEPHPLLYSGVAAAAAGLLAAGRPRLSAALLAGSGLLLLVGSGEQWVAAVTGALFLGAITSEMLLGHWYLVDPRLPRWALRRLDAAAGVGLVLDVAVLIIRGVLGWEAGDAVLGWAFLVLVVTSAVLVVAVWFALAEPAYSGVMAATGLSYLALLTAAGTTLVGRTLLEAGVA